MDDDVRAEPCHARAGRVEPPTASRPFLLERDEAALVLVVEDDPPVLDLMRRTLDGASFRALAARGYRDALRLAQGTELAALVTDVVLPDGDGQVLAAELSRRQPGLPVLLVTGADRQVAPGAALLLKPFVPLQLLAELDRVLGRRAG